MSANTTIPARPRRPRLASLLAGCLLTALLLLGGTAHGQTANTHVATIAGAFAGFVDGDNLVSQLNTPHGIEYDDQGNLYIADFGNNALRVLNVATETLVTLLGGSETPLRGPTDVALDSVGNVFVVNRTSGTVIRYNLQSGLWVTVGQGYLSPVAVEVDELGNIYVAEQAGHIRRVGQTAPIYSWQPGGQRFSGMVYLGANRFAVSDAGLHVIWVFNGTVRPVAIAGVQGLPGFANGGSGTSLLNSPQHLALSPSGGFVFADRNNHRVRYVDEDNVTRTLFGLPPSEWVDLPGLFPGWADGPVDWAESREPFGIDVGANGAVFDTEVYYHLVRMASGFVSTNVGTTNLPITAAFNPSTGYYPTGVVVSITSTSNTPLGPDARIFYTLDGSDPTTSSQAVPIINGVGTLTIPSAVDVGNLKVRIYNGTVAGPVVSGTPTTFDPVAVQLSPNAGFFPDGVSVSVLSASPGGFGSQIQLYYTLDGTDPDQNDIPVPIVNGVGTINFTGPIDLASLRVRAFNNNIPGPVTAGQPAPVPLPGISPSSGYFLTNTVVTITNRSGSTGFFPPGTTLYYTLDLSEPTQSSQQIPIVGGVGRLELTGPVNLENLKVKAYQGNTPGTTVQGEPTSFVPSRISFGFEPPQEASSDFIAAPGQRFYAPVTLTIPPGTTMYGLQFAITVTNLIGPPGTAGYEMGFESMLVKPQENGYVVIPPATFTSRMVEIIEIPVGDNVILFTNVTLSFSNLVFMNESQNLIGVGWLERYQFTNLYDTVQQDLIRYSQPHDTIFLSSNGKVVPGGVSFVVPTTANNGDQYQMRIIRPSANADGIREDVFIEAPDGSDPTVPITAVQTVTIGERRYIVGDLAPFRWFNAGDFGDGSILNNDMEQVHQTVIYGVNAPPADSDFEDSIDSCCISTNFVDLSDEFESWNGNDATINQIGYGDGELNIADLYVTFRRSLDPSLVWYERYWRNGARQASVVANTFRGQSTTLSAQSIAPYAPAEPEISAAATGEEPSVHFHVGAVKGNPGQTVSVPIYASVKGAYPIRTLLLTLKVKAIDGPTGLTQPVQFFPHQLLGMPQLGGAGTVEGYGAAWVDPNNSGLSGDALIGTLRIAIPAEADENTAIFIEFANASASPNGVGVLPSTTQDGLVIMENRTAIGWNDGIPDAWRIQYFGSLANLLSHPDADADGDAMTTRQEYLAGTNPMERLSSLLLQAGPAQVGNISLRLPTVAGKSYILEGTTNLKSGTWSVIDGNLAGTGETLEITPQSGGANYEFFRVRIAE